MRIVSMLQTPPMTSVCSSDRLLCLNTPPHYVDTVANRLQGYYSIVRRIIVQTDEAIRNAVEVQFCEHINKMSDLFWISEESSKITIRFCFQK